MKMSHPVLIALAFVAAVFVTIIALNFTTGEKEVRQKPVHQYDVADAQFLRSMGVLLGPTLVESNRVDTLLNGDEIFPAMLKWPCPG